MEEIPPAATSVSVAPSAMLPAGLPSCRKRMLPAFNHFADFDFVGIAYVCMSHCFSLL